MKCPFCFEELVHIDDVFNNERCGNQRCWYYKMSRYVRFNRDGIPAQEFLVLTDTICVHINHVHDRTIISRLDIVAISDHVILPRALKLDLSDIPRVIDKIQTLLIFS